MKKVYADKHLVLHLDEETERLIVYDLARETIDYQNFYSAQFQVELGKWKYHFLLSEMSQSGNVLTGNVHVVNADTGTEIRKVWKVTDL